MTSTEKLNVRNLRGGQGSTKLHEASVLRPPHLRQYFLETALALFSRWGGVRSDGGGGSDQMGRGGSDGGGGMIIWGWGIRWGGVRSDGEGVRSDGGGGQQTKLDPFSKNRISAETFSLPKIQKAKLFCSSSQFGRGPIFHLSSTQVLPAMRGGAFG